MWVENLDNADIQNNNVEAKLIRELEECPAEELQKNLEENLTAEHINELTKQGIEKDTIDDFLNQMWKFYNISKGEALNQIISQPDNIDEDRFKQFKTSIFWEKSEMLQPINSFNYMLLFYSYKDLPNEDFKNIVQIIENLVDLCDDWTYNITSEEFSNYFKRINKNKDKLSGFIRFCNKAIDKNKINKNINDWIKVTWIDYNDSSAREKSIEKRSLQTLSTLFLENFLEEPQALNLFEYINQNPVKLDNLWWKHIKSIDLNTETWINFCFRGILEMVKSRDDIQFPEYHEWATEQEKKQRETQRWKIIKEYENILRDYIAQDFEHDENWNTILDSNWEAIQIPRENTFDHIFFSAANGNFEDFNDAFTLFQKAFSKEDLQAFSKSPIDDFSTIVDENWKAIEWANNGWKNNASMIPMIEDYIKEHPNEKVLVYVIHHWGKNWWWSNWWDQEDWQELANISPNIKIWTWRCHFWWALPNETFYSNKSPLSGFSNKEDSYTNKSLKIKEWYNLWLGFNELELYTRLHYNLSATPLSTNQPYTNWETWERESLKNTGIAQNWNSRIESNLA